MPSLEFPVSSFAWRFLVNDGLVESDLAVAGGDDQVAIVGNL